jgi:hypothetical protein
MVHVILIRILNVLYCYISTLRSMCTVLNMAIFCMSLNSRFPDVLPRHFLNNLQMVPLAPLISGKVRRYIFDHFRQNVLHSVKRHEQLKYQCWNVFCVVWRMYQIFKTKMFNILIIRKLENSIKCIENILYSYNSDHFVVQFWSVATTAKQFLLSFAATHISWYRTLHSWQHTVTFLHRFGEVSV